MVAGDATPGLSRRGGTTFLLATIASLVMVVLATPGTGLAAARGGSAATRVAVMITDSTVGVTPSGLQAGAVSFVVANRGRKGHVLAIVGPGLGHAHTRWLAPGASTTLTLNLRTGAYMLTLTDPVGLARAGTHWLQVIPAVDLTSKGNTSVVQNPPDLVSPICGGLMP
jgi:hypothetical protein